MGGKELMKKILLICTDVVWDVAPYKGISKLPFVKMKAIMAPLHLATIAALTPDDIEVDLWDEAVHGQIDESTEFAKEYHLVGITGYAVHLGRAKQVAQIFRKRGIRVAIGGVGVSAAPETCRGFFDILLIGESELIWPRFIADWKAGNYRSEYRQVVKPDLAISPIPKWDSIAYCMESYAWGAVQTTRGCPFSCEFCDVIYLHGRFPRQKPIDMVLEEVSVLERLGMQAIFFCDDNFIGNTRYAKELVRELISLNRSFRYPVAFITQLTIDVAKNEELLELLADANFVGLFIGIETPNKESLIETKKLQNYKINLMESVRKIQSYGMAIRAGMIVGFDHDDKEIFNQQFQFLQEACIPMMSTHILRAPIGTPLWARLKNEGRIVLDEEHQIYGNLHGANTNIIPLKMTRVELFEGYLSLVKRLSEWRNFEARIKNFVSGVSQRPNVPQKKRPIQWKFLLGFLKYLLFSVDKETRRATFRIIRHTRRHAPFMLRRIIGLLGMQYSRLAMLQSVHTALHRRIEMEKSADFNLEKDQTDICIPENFKTHYRKILPQIHKRVYLSLADKTRTEEALVEIFADFIIRCGQTLDSFSDQHRDLLRDLTDHAVASLNGSTNDISSALTKSTNQVPGIKETRLAEDILKAMEQELRGNNSNRRKKNEYNLSNKMFSEIY
jgi:radical SAM superfamily enzyme YgiQ (UPF0313 family)